MIESPKFLGVLVKSDRIAAYKVDENDSFQAVLPGFNRRFKVNSRTIVDESVRLFGKTILPVFSARGREATRDCNFIYTRALNDEQAREEHWYTWMTGTVKQRRPGKYEVVGPAINTKETKKRGKIILDKKRVGLWLHDIEFCWKKGKSY